MNYNEINKIYEYMKTDIYPHCNEQWDNISTEEILIDRYLSNIDDTRKYKLLAVPYLMKSDEFLKKFKRECIVTYNTIDPADGLLLFIHQIDVDLHLASRLFCWVENDKVQNYIASLIFHKNLIKAVKFVTDNSWLRCEGDTEERESIGGIFKKKS